MEIFENDKSEQLLNTKGRYDYEHFAWPEACTIRSVLRLAIENYPFEKRALGLACEASPIVYKPRHILFKIILDEYPEPQKPYDLLAVAIAEYTEGYYWYESARRHFEQFFDTASFDVLNDIPPAYQIRQLYIILSKIYETIGDGPNAVAYYRKATTYDWYIPDELKQFWTPEQEKAEREQRRNCDTLAIAKLEQQMQGRTPTPLKKMGAKRQALEDQILAASRFFFDEVREDWYR